MNNATITFEGITRGSEIFGATQANFSVERPGLHAKETSILLNAPAAAYLATATGSPDDDAFRDHAARIAGEVWLEDLLANSLHIDSIYFLTKAAIEARPAILERLRALIPTPM